MHTEYGFDVPSDYKVPNWEMAGKVHEWKNYISPELMKIWDTFTDVQKATIAASSDYVAGLEEWE